MAVTRKGMSIELTAAADEVAVRLFLSEVRFVGTGLTAGQQLLIREQASGSVIAEHRIAAANENILLVANPIHVEGIYIDTMPASGGKVIARVE